MRCSYRGTCCPIPTSVPTHLNDSKNHIVIAVVLPCIFILVLTCAIYMLCGAKKRAKLCQLQKIDKSNNSIGEKNKGSEHDERRVYQITNDDIPC